jgi:hypothetical protein
MSVAPTVKMLVRLTPHLGIMGISFFWMYLTLGSRVRKARRAFEKQLISQGMSKEDARRLSECFNELKNSVTGLLQHGLIFRSNGQ